MTENLHFFQAKMSQGISQNEFYFQSALFVKKWKTIKYSILCLLPNFLLIMFTYKKVIYNKPRWNKNLQSTWYT